MQSPARPEEAPATEAGAPSGRFSSPKRGPLHFLRRIPDQSFALLLLLIPMLLLAGFTVLPMLTGTWNSLQEPGIDGGIGLAYYEQMLGDAVFRRSLRNNLIFSFVTVPVSLSIAMAMAILVNRKMRGRAFLRLAMFTPAMLPIVAAAAIWLFFYQPNFGVINTFAAQFGLPRQNWLGNPDTALPAIMVMMVWKEAGFFMLFYLAGLQAIPPELNEASSLEGAGRWYHFRRVTFPLVLPTTLFASIVGMANSFKQVDMIFVMTQGGPNNASNLLLYYIWQSTFPQRRPAYAAAITVVLVGILIVLAVVQIRLMDRRIHYR